MAKITLPDIGSLANNASARQAINENFASIETAFENTLSRDGTLPNQMEADIDLNDNDLLNVKRVDASEYFQNGIPWEQSVTYGDKLYDIFSGDGVRVDFPLKIDPASLANLEVSVGGLMQRPGLDYVYSGTTLTFIVPPPSAPNNILIRYDFAVPTGITTAASITYTPPSTSIPTTLLAFLDSLWNTGVNAGAKLIRWIQAGDNTAPRTVEEALRERISVKDFLCNDGLPVAGDGVHDDTTGIQRGINHVADNGGILHFPAGAYRLTEQIGRTVAAAKAFKLSGDGWTVTQLIRGADYGNVINFGNVNNVTVEDMTIVGNASVYPTNASHGIAFFNGSHVRIRRVKVFDWKNSAIIGYSFPAAPSSYINNLIEDCFADGGNAANNGILIADLARSGIRNCTAQNIGKTGSPCYALQMKNGCQDSFIEGGYAANATVGVAVGNYDISGTHIKNRVDGVRVFNCDTGIALGGNEGDTISNCLIDMNNGGLSAVDMNINSRGCSVTGITVRNHVSTRGVVRCRSGDTDNYVEIAMIDNNNGLAGIAAEFFAGSLRNTVEVKRYANPTTVSDSSAIVNDLSTGSTNVFTYAPLPNRQSATIASDAITLRHGRISVIRVDTEGNAATDNLATINGGVEGQIITINQAVNARDVTIKHGTGNIRLNGAVDFAFTTVHQTLTLMYVAGATSWVEVSRGTAA